MPGALVVVVPDTTVVEVVAGAAVVDVGVTVVEVGATAVVVEVVNEGDGGTVVDDGVGML